MPFLGNPGSCQPYESSSGTEALQNTETEHPHVIFTIEQILPTVFFLTLYLLISQKIKHTFGSLF